MCPLRFFRTIPCMNGVWKIDLFAFQVRSFFAGESVAFLLILWYTDKKYRLNEKYIGSLRQRRGETGEFGEHTDTLRTTLNPGIY